METKYTLEYYIEKLSKIPDTSWCAMTFKVGDTYCALGHCGAVKSVNDTEESRVLHSMCEWIGDINDNYDNRYSKLGTTPKERVINYLKSLRDVHI